MPLILCSSAPPSGSRIRRRCRFRASPTWSYEPRLRWPRAPPRGQAVWPPSDTFAGGGRWAAAAATSRARRGVEHDGREYVAEFRRQA
jgi:hypothetical protein